MDGSFLLSMVEKTPIYYGVFIIVAIIPIAIKTMVSLIDFYENVHLKRFFNRIKFLSENTPNNSEVSSYLESLKYHEIFKVATGINTYPEKAKMLMRIFELGIADTKELQRIHSNLEPLDLKVKASLSNLERLNIIYSFFVGSTLIFSGIFGAIYFQFIGPREAILASMAMFIFIFLGLVLLRDFMRYKTLIRVTNALYKLEQYADNDSDIRLINFKAKMR